MPVLREVFLKMVDEFNLRMVYQISGPSKILSGSSFHFKYHLTGLKELTRDVFDIPLTL